MSAAPAPAERFPISSLPLDPALEACWNLAGWIGQESSDDHLRSFTTLLLALLHGDDPISKWFLRYARAARIDLDQIYASRQFRPSGLKDLKPRIARGEEPQGKPSHTASARNMISGGAEVMKESGATVLAVRHLLGAYFYRLPRAHIDQMRKWGFDSQRDGSALARQMKARFPAEAEHWERIHAAALSEPPDLDAPDPILPPKITSFAADTPEGDDHLNIEDDVYALSALICSTRVEPPLSIGLFGDWGSGKSFFIRQLQRGVSWISGDARNSGRMQKDIHFFKNVVQIEFNAWNYSGGNLWASLVQHILENLRLAPDESEDMVARRVNHLKQKMELEQQVRDAATARQVKAQKEVNDTQKRLDMLRTHYDAEIEALQKVLADDVMATVKMDPGMVGRLNSLREELKLPAVAESAGEFLTAIDSTRNMLTRLTALVEYVPPAQRKQFRRDSALLLAAPPVAAIGIGLLIAVISPHAALLSGFAGWASTAMALGARWLRQRTEQLSVPLATLENLQAHARQRVDAAEQEHRAEAAGLEQRIALARDEILAAQVKQQEAESNLERIKAELAATTPARVLADFVRERSESEDYRQHLGLPAVIRRDFDSISRMVAQENEALRKVKDLEQENLYAGERINRIVLYIDDLDRCPEPLVVEVLKAVHLLLAFPLFIVVVAVDARWVSRSLSRQFPGLLTSSRRGGRAARGNNSQGHATPNDYLEKIFQIPLWLQAPDEDAVRRMVRGLVRENLLSPGGTAGEDASARTNGTQGATEEGRPVFKQRQHDPNAASLDIQEFELQFAELLAPFLGRSPRALKRFVNLYRLLKASLPPEEHDDFLEEGKGIAPYKAVLFLLALATGQPGFSHRVLDALLESSDGMLPEILEKLAEDSQARARESAHLSDWLNRNLPGWQEADPAQFLRWVPRVSRYSYHLHRA